MFLFLLVVTFLISVGVCSVCVLLFKGAIANILQRIISDSIYTSWVRYLIFAIYIVGISAGVRVWDLEKYIEPDGGDSGVAVMLNLDRWVLEIYRTVIGTLQGVAWMLLVFFVVALIAYVIVRLRAPAPAK